MKNTTKENQPKAPEKLLLKVIGDFCQEIRPSHDAVEEVSLNSTFERDLGLDSLSRVELISRVESAFNLALPENSFAEAQTPRDLLHALSGVDVDHPDISTVKEPSIQSLKTSDYPIHAQTLVDILEWHASNNPERPHIQFYQDDAKGEVITYRQLQKNAQNVAASLQEYGLKKGDTVAIMLPTCREYFFSFFGILIAGGIPVPIYPPARPSQLEEHISRHTKILNNSLADILITIPEAVALAHILKSKVPNLNQIVSASKLLTPSKKVVRPALHSDDVAFIQYTSGSTGDPKGVTLSNANLLANIRAMGKAVDANSKDVFVSWLPLYHDMGLIGAWLGSLYFGALYVVMSPLSFLSKPQRWLWAIHRYRGTLSASPNFGYEYCLHRIQDKDFKGLDLSSWRAAFNGAEAVSPETISRFIEHFTPFGFDKKSMMPVYGLAESSVGLAFPPLKRGVLIDYIKRDTFMKSRKAIPANEEDEHPLRFISSGLVLQGHQIRVVDLSGNELPERQEGQLQFCGPSSTKGYFRNAKKTEGLFDSKWLNSGDLAYIAGGELYITGRIKDIIIRGGRNIYPDELEKAISDIEGIRKGCVVVFGTIDAKSATERLVVMAESRSDDSNEKIKFRKKINSIATDLIAVPPDEVVIVPPGTILKTSSGKIRRSSCKEMYENNEIGKKNRSVPIQIAKLLISSAIPQLRRMANYFKSFAYALYCWFAFVLLAPPAWLGAVILPNLTFRWKTVAFFAKLLAKIIRISVKVKGLENIPKGSEKYIIVINHSSYIDALIIAVALPGELRFVSKAELSKNIFTALPLKKLHAEFVERFDTSKSVDAAQHLLNSLKAEKPLIFFPEGTFTRVPGLGQFHLGAFQTAAKAKVRVIPIAIRGSRSILHPGSWFPRYGSVTVTIGEALDTQDIAKNSKNQTEWDLTLELRDRSREFILRHCGEPDLTS